MDFKNSDQLKSYLKKESARLNISITNVYNNLFLTSGVFNAFFIVLNN